MYQILTTLLSKIGLRPSPVKGRILVVAQEQAKPVTRMLGGASDRIEVVSDAATAKTMSARHDAVLLDMELPGAWEWLREERDTPIIALVHHEATAIRAILRGGAATALNVLTMKAPELIEAVAKVIHTKFLASSQSPQELAEGVRDQTARTLVQVSTALQAHCQH